MFPYTIHSQDSKIHSEHCKHSEICLSVCHIFGLLECFLFCFFNTKTGTIITVSDFSRCAGDTSDSALAYSVSINLFKETEQFIQSGICILLFSISHPIPPLVFHKVLFLDHFLMLNTPLSSIMSVIQS